MTKLQQLKLKRKPRTIGDMCRYIAEANTVIDDGFVDVRTHNPELPRQVNSFLKEKE